MDIEITPELHLHYGPLPVERISQVLSRWAEDSRIGGVTSFAGVVRADKTEDGKVSSIEFSAYQEMAEPGIRAMAERIAAEVVEEHGGPVRLYVEHALGPVRVGEIPIVIVAGAGHRPAAFELCRSVLEALKSEIPIYGKELFEDAGHRWKENR
ncbi:MAG: molybdenum cofactor biosynthesis protein MoaE [Alkalispirochaetaceae bacterium]